MIRFSHATSQFLQYLRTMERSPETIRSYGEHFKQLGAYLNNHTNSPLYVDDVTAETLRTYLHYLRMERHYTPASQAHVLHTLRSFYRYLSQQNLAQDVTRFIDPIRVPQKERRYLNDADVRQLAVAMPTPLLQLVTRFLFYTGLRISECLRLTVDDVDLTTRVIHVRGGKEYQDRTVPIARPLYDELANYVAARPAMSSSLFFVTARTGQLSHAYVNQRLKAVARQLEFPYEVTAQTLRHSFARRVLAQGVSLSRLQQWLGHASVATTILYAPSLPEERSWEGVQ